MATFGSRPRQVATPPRRRWAEVRYIGPMGLTTPCGWLAPLFSIIPPRSKQRLPAAGRRDRGSITTQGGSYERRRTGDTIARPYHLEDRLHRAVNFLNLAAEAKPTHTGTNQQKSGSGGPIGICPPAIACPRFSPSRATTRAEALPPRPLAVPCANSPSTPPSTSAPLRRGRPRAGPRRPHPPHRPTHTAGRAPCSPSPTPRPTPSRIRPSVPDPSPLPTLNSPRPLVSYRPEAEAHSCGETT